MVIHSTNVAVSWGRTVFSAWWRSCSTSCGGLPCAFLFTKFANLATLHTVSMLARNSLVPDAFTWVYRCKSMFQQSHPCQARNYLSDRYILDHFRHIKFWAYHYMAQCLRNLLAADQRLWDAGPLPTGCQVAIYNCHRKHLGQCFCKHCFLLDAE